MEDVLGYKGKRVVVGGSFSGMGAATASALLDMGADVISIDIKKPSLPVSAYHEIDLRDGDAIKGAADAIGGSIDALFCCAGLPGPPFSGSDVARVNFFGTRLLVETLLPLMAEGSAVACVSSNAGLGWQMNLETLTPALDAEGYEAGEAWIKANTEMLDTGMAYPLSKQLICAYVASRAMKFYEKGVRLNNTNPGPTATPMMAAFEEANTKKVVEAALGPIARYSTPEEQAWPLLYLNSPRSSYITGESIMVDGGFLGAMTTGQIDFGARLAG